MASRGRLIVARIASRVGVVAASVLVLTAAPALANASVQTGGTPTPKAPTRSQLIVSSAPVSKPNAENSSLTITFDTGQPGTSAIRPSTLTTLVAGTAASVPQIVPPGGGSSNPALLNCNHAYSFSDANGVFSIQHACGSGTAAWGYKLGGICSFAISPASEYGMSWTRNGTPQARQAAHSEPCTYQFHGTFNPGRDNDTIAYSDAYTFKVLVPGSGTGTANLNMWGLVKFLAYPCSPTSC